MAAVVPDRLTPALSFVVHGALLSLFGIPAETAKNQRGIPDACVDPDCHSSSQPRCAQEPPDRSCRRTKSRHDIFSPARSELGRQNAAMRRSFSLRSIYRLSQLRSYGWRRTKRADAHLRGVRVFPKSRSQNLDASLRNEDGHGPIVFLAALLRFVKQRCLLGMAGYIGNRFSAGFSHPRMSRCSNFTAFEGIWGRALTFGMDFSYPTDG